MLKNSQCITVVNYDLSQDCAYFTLHWCEIHITSFMRPAYEPQVENRPSNKHQNTIMKRTALLQYEGAQNLSHSSL